ncbi:hypothetical protein Hypma_002977 [Hypsizygus marmoreus]|uniref:Uncharacterized protein n=1 Tax=Hypsizygus marmoreus TaxID=39966 RepID=A0A369J6X8_HYPMA|nr:hypothetical protein Hypma_002977 [Hypsizygus marmoreus]
MNAVDYRNHNTIQRWWFEDAYNNRYTELTIEQRVYHLLPCSNDPVYLTAAQNMLIAALHDLEDTMILYGRDDLRWVIAYTYHGNDDDPAPRWTAQGFNHGNVSVATVHCYSGQPAKWYCNGGKSWRGVILDFDTWCIPL